MAMTIIMAMVTIIHKVAFLLSVRERYGFEGPYNDKSIPKISCSQGRRREEVEETLRGSTEAILRVAPRTRRTLRDDQEKERRRGMVVEENEASSSNSRGFLRQTQTQHRLPRSYYGGQRIYKMASTGDLVIQGSGESRPGDRRSHR